MRHCFNCALIDECECGIAIKNLGNYLGLPLYESICELIQQNINCDEYEPQQID